MFAFECHFTEEHVDWAMDMDRIFAHLEYRSENPPAGLMLKLALEALGGKKSDTTSNNEVSNSLEDFIADFSGSGGELR